MSLVKKQLKKAGFTGYKLLYGQITKSSLKVGTYQF